MSENFLNNNSSSNSYSNISSGSASYSDFSSNNDSNSCTASSGRKHRIKPLSEQTFKNNFMFCAVMSSEDICRKFLELILGIEVSRIEVCKEKCFIYNPVYKGIRLDVFAKGEDGKHYDIDLQVSRTPIELRTRYYHSQMDMEMSEEQTAST